MGKSTKTKSLTTEIGTASENRYRGYSPNPDYNRTLTGRGRIREYDKMRLGDATARACFRAITLPILRAKWRLKAASDSSIDKEVKEFVEDNIFREMSRTWSEFLTEALVYLVHGNAIFELVYEFSKDGKIRIKKLARRPSDTITDYQLSNGQLGVIQQTSSGDKFEIPIEKLLILVNEKEGDNWEGQSIFRAAYRNYYIKDKLLSIDAMAAERQGLGVPFLELPPGTKTNNPQLWESSKEILQNMRANEGAYLLYEKGSTAGFLDMKASTTKDIPKSIELHNREMTKSVLADFLELGATATGSFALSEDKTDMFLLSLEAVADYVAACMNEYVIKRLVDFNFNVEAYPTLEFAGIRQDDLKEAAEALSKLVGAKVIIPDDDLEAHIREQFKLPEKSADAPERDTDLDSDQDEDIDAHDHTDSIKGKEGEILETVKLLKEKVDLALDRDESNPTA